MFYDASGRANPNGEFELRRRSRSLKDGEYARFDMAFLDSAPASTFNRDQTHAATRAVRDAVRDARYLPSASPLTTSDDQAAAPRQAVDTSSIRDAALAARYGGN
jgi:hypothetical protein